MTLVDSNIPMYLIGAPHPHKADAQVLLERLAASGEKLVTDAEVMQEILHRYTAIRRPEAISPAMRLLLGVVEEVLPIDKKDVLRAGEICQHKGQFSARDAIHIAIMERHSVDSILSFDDDYDRWPGLKRIHRV